MKIFSLRTKKNVLFWSIVLGLAINLFAFTLVSCADADALAPIYQFCRIGFPLQFEEIYYFVDFQYTPDEVNYNQGVYSVSNYAAFFTHTTFWVNSVFWILASFVLLMVTKWIKGDKIKQINP